MRITRAADIGLRALMVLAARPDRLTTVAELAGELAVPERHLGKVVQRLAAAGQVETLRGRGGGLRIAAGGLAATAAQVLTTVEGAQPVIDCLDPPCPLVSAGCRLRHLLGEAQGAFYARLEAVTIADLAGEPGSLPSRVGNSGASAR